ncbi:hypothetical protein RUND412_001123 [Rhizina undulata]
MQLIWVFLAFLGIFLLLHPEDFHAGLGTLIGAVVWRLRGFAVGAVVLLLLKLWAEGGRIMSLHSDLDLDDCAVALQLQGRKGRKHTDVKITRGITHCSDSHTLLIESLADTKTTSAGDKPPADTNSEPPNSISPLPLLQSSPEELLNVKLSFGISTSRPKQKSVSHAARALSKKHWARIRSNWGDTSKIGLGTPVRKQVEAAGHMGYTWLKPAKA